MELDSKKLKEKEAQAKKLVEKTDSLIDSEHERIVEDTVRHEASTYAQKDLPSSHDTSFEAYITTIRGEYDRLQQSVRTKLKGGLQSLMNSISIPALNKKIDELTATLSIKQKRLNDLLNDRKRKFGSSTSGTNWVLPLFILLGIGESLLNVTGFLSIGDVWITALIIGAIVGLAQVFGTKYAIINIREIEDNQKQRKYYILLTMCAIAVSLGFALWRSKAMHSNESTSVFSIEILAFTLVNLLFVGATALITFYHIPSKKENKKIEDCKAFDKEISKAQHEVRNAETTLSGVQAFRSRVFALNSQLEHDEQKLLKKVAASYDLAIGIFKHENVIKRNDNIFPHCFNTPHVPLDISEEFVFVTNKYVE